MASQRHDRWARWLFALMLPLQGCLLSAAVAASVGAIRMMRGGDGADASVRLDRSAREVYEGVLAMETDWRDAKITEADPKKSKRRIRIEIDKRDAEVWLRIEPLDDALSTVTVKARSGTLRMTDEEFAAQVLERLCRQLNARCYRVDESRQPRT